MFYSLFMSNIWAQLLETRFHNQVHVEFDPIQR